jgi:hypothetical protein
LKKTIAELRVAQYALDHARVEDLTAERGDANNLDGPVYRDFLSRHATAKSSGFCIAYTFTEARR